MKNIQLVDTHHWDFLKPITLTKSCADIRLGIFKLREKWKNLGANPSIKTRGYLQPLYGTLSDSEITVNSSLLPNHQILEEILHLNAGTSLWHKDIWVASHLDELKQNNTQTQTGCHFLKHPEDLFVYAGSEIQKDLALIVKEHHWKPLPKTNMVIGNNEVYLASNAKIEGCILNTEEGPIVIGENAHVMEGSILRGPISIGHNTVIKMGARIYQNTSIGPGCKIGGEIKNSVILGYSNKAHDGYMGNSVIGEWCNWGADTNNSNMKNNYTTVKLWDYNSESFRDTHNQFVGLIMGDHSKTGINTMFNTGTVVGVSCNIYGTGFPRKFIPSFSWGGAHGFKTYLLSKALETAAAAQKRRDLVLPKAEIEMINNIFTESAKYRRWEKK